MTSIALKPNTVPFFSCQFYMPHVIGMSSCGLWSASFCTIHTLPNSKTTRHNGRARWCRRKTTALSVLVSACAVLLRPPCGLPCCFLVTKLCKCTPSFPCAAEGNVKRDELGGWLVLSEPGWNQYVAPTLSAGNTKERYVSDGTFLTIHVSSALSEHHKYASLFLALNPSLNR